ncbi:AMP-binding protein [Aminobacter sp. SS-2016]|uniref:acyl-CoA synthetase n=1 Tax=Aminobacter sp. Y103A TaxID=1870862 RepID=UPI0025741E67|nr:AMP-binding protein [Aminobacter sp. SS-2016]
MRHDWRKKPLAGGTSAWEAKILIPTTVSTYDELIANFAWDVPRKLNIGFDICDRHATSNPDAIALIEDADGAVKRYTYSDLKRITDNLAHSFTELGVKRGDRVVVSLGQNVEAVFVHIACFKVGAISVPIAGLYAGEALAFRIYDCEASLIVTDRSGADKLHALDKSSPRLVVIHDGAKSSEIDFDNLIAGNCGAFPMADTESDDPAMIFYTSGSTGSPKGVLHGHRLVIGHLPCFQLGFEMAPQDDDVFWTASDWSWLGSLGDLVFPGLYSGKTVISTPGRFTPERAYRVMEEHKVTCPFLATAVLRKMSKEPSPADARFCIRGIMTGGEAMPPEVFKWSQQTFGVPVNDEFGLTEANQMSVGCETLYQTPAGSVGRIAPGKKVVILDPAGEILPVGERGEIAVWFDSPGNMLGYWNRPEQSVKKLVGGWFRTGDEGRINDQGYLFYYGRLDDLILVNGLRVGPEEVEATLMTHPSVKEAAVVGLPDPSCGEAVVAALVLKDGIEGTDQLIDELKRRVKRDLAVHSYPKRMIFVDDIPVTTTGKIRRREVRMALLGAEK